MVRQSQNDSGDEDRPRWILSQAALRNDITYREVAQRYEKSSAQRILRELVLQGKLIRASHGSYKLPVENAAAEGLWGSPYAEKRLRHGLVKQAFAEHIVIKHCKGVSGKAGTLKLGLDAGTACTFVGEALKRFDIFVERLYTSNLDAALHLMGLPKITEVRIKGGTLSKAHAAISGEMSNEESNWNVDVAILGVSRVFVNVDDPELPFVALCIADKTQWAFKQWLASCDIVIIPALAEKIGRHSEDVFSRVYKGPNGPVVRHVGPNSQQTKKSQQSIILVVGDDADIEERDRIAEEWDRMATVSGIRIERVSLAT